MQDQPNPSDSFEIGATPSVTPQEPTHPALDTELSRELFGELTKKDRETPGSRLEAARIYLGAKTVRWQLKTPINPEYIPQAAHSIRELIELLPEKFNITVVNHPDLVQRHREILRSWDQDGKPLENGSPNARRPQFDIVMASMADVDQQVRTSHHSRSEQLLMEMDVSKRSLPPEQAREQLREWGLYRKYFVDVCHHRILATEAEFDERLQSLEAFLIARRRPRVLEDQAPLRAIIDKGEAGA